MKKTLMVLAAGLGSRYGGIKQVAPVGPNGETLLDYAIYDAKKAGFDKIVFIIKREIENEFKEVVGIPASKHMEVHYAYQDEAYLPDFYQTPKDRVKMLGTVHAMLAAKDIIEEPFAIINADDYYGQSAFDSIVAHLTQLSQARAAMVGYYLKNTVSPNGAVTRGVCHAVGGKLVSVTETYSVGPFPDGTIRSTADSEEGIILNGDSVVSMNFWGFSEKIFPIALACFDAFLKNLPDGDLTTEYPLPTMVDDLIKAEKLSVDVLTSEDSWMGITFPEDLDAVKEGLKRLTQAGNYPNKIK